MNTPASGPWGFVPIRLRPVLQRVTAPTVLWALLFILPFIVFFSYVYRYAINVPVHDDYDVALGFMNTVVAPGTAGEKLGALWEQDNESRLILVKVLALIDYGLFHNVDFRVLLIAGNIVRALVVLLLTFRARSMGLGKYQLLFVPYLLLAPISTENINFMTGQAHIWAILVILLFLLALERNQPLAYCILYPLGIFTFSGGLLMYPTGIAFLALKRRWKGLLGFGITSTLLTLGYFTGLSRAPDFPRSAFENFSQAVKAFFAFFGAAAYSYEIALLLGVMGVICLVATAMLTDDKEEFLRLSAVWLLLYAGAVALGRSRGELGVGILPPRYFIYSQLAAVVVLLWAFQRSRSLPHLQTRLAAFATLVAVGFFSSALLVDHYSRVFDRERDFKITGLTSLAELQGGQLLVYPRWTSAAAILLESRRLGIYDYKAVGPELRRNVLWLTNLPAQNRAVLQYVDENNGLRLAGWALIPEINSAGSRIHVLLRIGSQVAVIETYSMIRPDVSGTFGKTRTYDYSGYEVYLAAYALPPGVYELGFMVENRDRIGILWDTRSVVVQ